MNYKRREMTTKHFKLEYYQKSHAFLYPLLGISKKSLFTPINTYLFCDCIDESIADYKLLVLYKYENKLMFEDFEKENILTNQYFETCYLTEDGIVYVFNLAPFEKTVELFLNGQYSKFEKKIKDIILTYYGFVSGGQVIPVSKIVEGKVPILKGSMYPMSVLYPLDFKELLKKEFVDPIDIYATEEEADRGVRDIQEIGSVFDSGKETLNTKLLDDTCMKT